ncbi:MAG: translocation protein TolB [Tuberibacillus sp.]
MRILKRTLFVIFMIILIIFPGSNAAAEGKVHIAFIRDKNLWIKVNNQEKPLTHNSSVRYPKWSRDRRYLAYLEGRNNERLWVYDTRTKKSKVIFQAGVNRFEWSPVDHQLAFLSGKVLNISDPDQTEGPNFKNVMLGIGNFSWRPDGKGFIVSSMANLLPTGWTSVKLYYIPRDADMDTSKVKLLYTLPNPSPDFFAVSTSPFKWSPDGKWVSFLAIPTASASADSNTLCILSAAGKTFMAVDQMLANQEWFQWAPSENRLGYIEGSGRFAIQNKHLKIKKLPANGRPSYTPKGFADRGLTWINNNEVIVSRSKEAEWDNNPSKRPLPSLYKIELSTGKQKPLIKPEHGYGDFNPVYKNGSLYWARTNRQTVQLLTSNANGNETHILIKGIDTPPDYYETRDWQAVLSIE